MKLLNWGPALLGIGALTVGIAVMGGLLTFKKAPAEATASRDEKAIHVEVVAVEPRDVPVTIEGYGEVAALRTVSISPEVSGRVTAAHPELVAGGHVKQGDVLFTIDPRPYEARVAEAEAEVARRTTALQRLAAEERHLREDLKDRLRQRELASNAHARAEKLYEEGVGSHAAVDQAEQSLVTARNEHDRVSRDLSLQPIRVGEAESELLSAEARLKMAQVDLERAEVTAPFTGRVASEQIEVGALVGGGGVALVLVDDSVLEIAVPLNSQDARRWLRFQGGAGGTGAWFDPLEPVACGIRWTENPEGEAWEGTLDRVENYDEEARTLTVIVRVGKGQQRSAGDRFPLVAGMFCSVAIPGRPMNGVFQLPSHAVSFDDNVYLADGDRLRTAPVEVARIEDDFTFVSGGLRAGDRVITTRLVNPLDNTLLSVAGQDGETEG